MKAIAVDQPLLRRLHHAGFCAVLALTSVMQSGCSSLLPHSKLQVLTPWHSYAEAEALYARVVPDKTTLTELHAYGLDPAKTANVAILSHDDLLRRIVAMASVDLNNLDPALRECVKAYQKCFAYELKQDYSERNRIGNFFLDFLTFKQVTDVTGWQFDAVIVISDDKVIYKLWSGKPMVHQLEDTRHPLGPLQGLGTALIR
jgi:hypothetical protein